jgi:putative ubiquitin-RnfH superfamily antitoxin RatB of RatAB toxin-antitoxin module
MAPNKTLPVEVAYARPDKQLIIKLEIEAGATIGLAIQRSGILTLFPDIDLTTQKVGVFGKTRQLHDVIQAGDRIEIYRPLQIDPKEARRKREAKAKTKK